jgi:hypothetical protein
VELPIECPDCGADVCLVYGVTLHCSRSHWDTTSGRECGWVYDERGARLLEIGGTLDDIVNGRIHWSRVSWFREIGARFDASR